MGREIVRGFIKEGSKVIATDVSWTPTGVSNDTDDFFAEIKDNPHVLAATMDITIQAHVDFVYKQAIEKFGTIDVIICNGGTRQRDLYHETHGSVTILETEVNDWQRMFDTHVFGNLRVIKRFVQPMIEKGRGSIITSASSQIVNAHPRETCGLAASYELGGLSHGQSNRDADVNFHRHCLIPLIPLLLDRAM